LGATWLTTPNHICCAQVPPVARTPSTGFMSTFSLTSANSLPSAPTVCSAMAMAAGTGPPPRMKISTSAMTMSGKARITSSMRRNSPAMPGQRARPRVESSDSTAPPTPPISVATAAMFTVSIRAGRYFSISPGRAARSRQASSTTPAGKSRMREKPSRNAPAFWFSASPKAPASVATNSVAITAVSTFLRRSARSYSAARRSRSAAVIGALCKDAGGAGRAAGRRRERPVRAAQAYCDFDLRASMITS
jgi:hypothetical protein